MSLVEVIDTGHIPLKGCHQVMWTNTIPIPLVRSYCDCIYPVSSYYNPVDHWSNNKNVCCEHAWQFEIEDSVVVLVFLQTLYNKTNVGDLIIGMELNKFERKPLYAFLVAELVFTPKDPVGHILHPKLGPNTGRISLCLDNHHRSPSMPHNGQGHTWII